MQNEGAPLAEDVRARLFESMFQQRADTPGKPHFGLGLYIVRLIAEFHGGRVFAENLPDRHAVRIGVANPLAAVIGTADRRGNLQKLASGIAEPWPIANGIGQESRFND